MSSSITEINTDTFWTLIDRAKEHSGGPSEWLMEQLVSMGPEQAKSLIPSPMPTWTQPNSTASGQPHPLFWTVVQMMDLLTFERGW